MKVYIVIRTTSETDWNGVSRSKDNVFCSLDELKCRQYIRHQIRDGKKKYVADSTEFYSFNEFKDGYFFRDYAVDVSVGFSIQEMEVSNG